MAEQEQEHQATFNALMRHFRVRPTALAPFWNVAGFALGMHSMNFVESLCSHTILFHNHSICSAALFVIHIMISSISHTYPIFHNTLPTFASLPDFRMSSATTFSVLFYPLLPFTASTPFSSYYFNDIIHSLVLHDCFVYYNNK